MAAQLRAFAICPTCSELYPSFRGCPTCDGPRAEPPRRPVTAAPEPRRHDQVPAPADAPVASGRSLAPYLAVAGLGIAIAFGALAYFG